VARVEGVEGEGQRLARCGAMGGLNVPFSCERGSAEGSGSHEQVQPRHDEGERTSETSNKPGISRETPT